MAKRPLPRPVSAPELSPPPTDRDNLPVGGRTKYFAAEWYEVAPEPWHQGTIGPGLKLNFISLPPLSPVPIPVHLPSDPVKAAILIEEVQDMLRKAAIEKVIDPGPGFYSHLFVCKKKSGKFRPVIDLKALNKFLVIPHFKMETPQSIRQQLNPFDWVVTIDMKDAYFHIPVHKSYRKYLRFMIQGVVYQFAAMCFGLATAPFIFTKVFRPFAAYLRRLAILIYLYLDDWLIKAESPEKLLADLDVVLKLAKKLGILINWDKSDITPRQLFVHLGMRFDLKSCLVFPTLDALAKIKIWAKYLRQYRRATAKALLSFLGLLNHACEMVPMGRLQIRPFQFFVNHHWKAHRESLDKVILLDEVFLRQLTWWENPQNTSRGAALHAPKAELTVLTDASTHRWGGHLNAQVKSGTWTSVEQRLHINVLEMKAVLLTLREFADEVANRCVLVLTDNTTVVAYIKNQGGTHSLPLFRATRELFQWTETNGVTLRVSHIPGKLNVVADMLSRKNQILPTEWSLSPTLFRQIHKLCPAIQVDLFANCLNHQIPTYVSPVPDDQAWAVDALSFPWDGLTAYAYPPTSLIAQSLRKIRESDCVVILVAPCWSSQIWFPVMLELLVDLPIRLPTSRTMLRQPQSHVYHTKPETLHLHVWALSSRTSLREDFLKRLHDERQDLKESLLYRSTSPTTRHSVVGVLEGRSVWSLSLFK